MKENPNSEMWKISNNLSEVNGKTAFAAKDKTAKDVVKNYLGYLSEGVLNYEETGNVFDVCVSL